MRVALAVIRRFLRWRRKRIGRHYSEEYPRISDATSKLRNSDLLDPDGVANEGIPKQVPRVIAPMTSSALRFDTRVCRMTSRDTVILAETDTC